MRGMMKREDEMKREGEEEGVPKAEQAEPMRRRTQ